MYPSALRKSPNSLSRPQSIPSPHSCLNYYHFLKCMLQPHPACLFVCFSKVSPVLSPWKLLLTFCSLCLNHSPHPQSFQKVFPHRKISVKIDSLCFISSCYLPPSSLPLPPSPLPRPTIYPDTERRLIHCSVTRTEHSSWHISGGQ